MPARRPPLAAIGLAAILLLGLPAFGWVVLSRVFNPPIKPSIGSHLAELFDAGRYQDLISECDSLQSEPQYSSAAPQILYIQWVADRKLGNLPESDRIQQSFLQQFPTDSLVAQFDFADAMQLLIDQKFQQADAKLEMITKDFPKTDVAARCAQIRKNLDQELATAKKANISTVHSK